jgi:hypothetical protein
MRSRVRLISDTSGAAALVIALALPFVVGGFGLGTEVGAWYFNQRKLQNAADVAAFAAATQVRAGRAQAIAQTTYVAWAEEAALAAAARTGFRSERGRIQVQTPYNNDANRVEVQLLEEVPRGFSALFARGTVDLGGRAVAEIESDGFPTCVLALDPAGAGALTFQGNTGLTINGCNTHANSLNENAVVVQGNPRVTTDCISMSGGIDLPDRKHLLTLTDCEAPVENAVVVPDPFAHVQPPADIIAENCQPQTQFGSNTSTTISKGRYCGDLVIQGTVTMNPGVYVVEGNVRINAGATLTGTGVTIYIKGSHQFHSAGTATIQLSAPESGPYEGVLVYADQPQGSTPIIHKMNGTTASFYDGAFYAPRGEIEILGDHGGQSSCTQVVAHRIKFTGNSNVTIDCTGSGLNRFTAGQRIWLRE